MTDMTSNKSENTAHTQSDASESVTSGNLTGSPQTELDSLADAENWLRSRAYHTGQIEEYRIDEPTEGSPGETSIESAVRIMLQKRGIEQLYEHQSKAIEYVRDGHHLTVATPTASGKSLTYIVPICESAIASRSGGTALYIAPARALINDQEQLLTRVGEKLPFDNTLTASAYTGATSRQRRREIKNAQPDVILMTPDMVHESVLRYGHAASHWRWLLSNLEYVVIDEVHKYRGVFGSHVSLILRRLNRLCSIRGSSPKYICCSATIGNPVEHAAAVTGKPETEYKCIETDTSESGPRHWALWNPPVKSNNSLEQSAGGAQRDTTSSFSETDSEQPVLPPAYRGDTNSAPNSVTGATAGSTQQAQTTNRRSHNIETLRLFCDLVSEGYQVLVFAQTRQQASRYIKNADKKLRELGYHDSADSIVEYHAGLKSTDRTAIESQIKNGTIRGIWATEALELGIDIGELDAVILNGYPGTTMQTFQRAGRAGRGTDPALVILVGAENPLDQRIMNDPDRLFESSAEQAVVNPANESVLREHLLCAADESFLRPSHTEYFGDIGELVADQTEAGQLTRVTERGVAWEYSADTNIHRQTDIRQLTDREFSLIESETDELATLSLSDMLRDAFPGALYTHQKSTYRVTDVDLNRDVCHLQASENPSHYTEPVRPKDITVTEIENETTLFDEGPFTVQTGLATVSVHRETEKYFEFSGPRDTTPTEKEISQRLPADDMLTESLYFTLPTPASIGLTADDGDIDIDTPCGSAIHGIEHALISLFPTRILCDRHDIGGLSAANHPEFEKPVIFIHDAHEGGADLTRTAYPQLQTLLTETRDLIRSCQCTAGCPACILSPQCGNNNRHLWKDGALQYLDALLETGEDSQSG